MPAKLHEILAVEGDKEGVFKKIIEETIINFKKKPELFTESHRTYEPFDESERDKVEGFEEHHAMTTTVMDRLNWTMKPIVEYVDVILQKEVTNKKAKADLEVDGIKIGDGLPATFLLGLENKLKTIRKIFEEMPTLPPGSNWQPDEQRGKHIFKLEPPDKKFRTAKTFEHKILVAPTEKHPAQIERWEEMKNIGTFVTNRWNGMVSSAQKAIMIGRIDKLIQATKKARQRANCEEVVVKTIGQEIASYIMEGA